MMRFAISNCTVLAFFSKSSAPMSAAAPELFSASTRALCAGIAISLSTASTEYCISPAESGGVVACPITPTLFPSLSVNTASGVYGFPSDAFIFSNIIYPLYFLVSRYSTAMFSMPKGSALLLENRKRILSRFRISSFLPSTFGVVSLFHVHLDQSILSHEKNLALMESVRMGNHFPAHIASAFTLVRTKADSLHAR